MKKINVTMYGGKGIFKEREQPYNVDVAYCDKCDQCDFYKNGTCFNAGRIKCNCRIGKKENIRGRTSKSLAGREFYSKWKNDECYALLKEPKRTIGIVDDIVILNINCMKLNENNEPVEDVGFGKDGLSYISLKDFTPNLIKQICDLRPRTLFNDGFIRAYYEEYVPKFLDDLKRNYKDIWNNFISVYSEYDKEINYVGRMAYISSLRNGLKIRGSGSEWQIKDDYIICENWRDIYPFNARYGEVKIKITDNLVCEITTNEQVDENTKFYD
ncbi:MAG: hypothetical protein K2M17_03370 [Bacilli bacterium]|nr:hypothetical protein [Bacilli bacterium]